MFHRPGPLTDLFFVSWCFKCFQMMKGLGCRQASSTLRSCCCCKGCRMCLNFYWNTAFPEKRLDGNRCSKTSTYFCALMLSRCVSCPLIGHCKTYTVRGAGFCTVLEYWEQAGWSLSFLEWLMWCSWFSWWISNFELNPFYMNFGSEKMVVFCMVFIFFFFLRDRALTCIHQPNDRSSVPWWLFMSWVIFVITAL